MYAENQTAIWIGISDNKRKPQQNHLPSSIAFDLSEN